MSGSLLQRFSPLLCFFLLCTACDRDVQGPVVPDASFAKGTVDPIPEIAYVGHQAPFLSIVDVSAMQEIGRIPINGQAANPTVSPDGRTVWVPTQGPPTLAKIDVASDADTTLSGNAISRPEMPNVLAGKIRLAFPNPIRATMRLKKRAWIRNMSRLVPAVR